MIDSNLARFAKMLVESEAFVVGVARLRGKYADRFLATEPGDTAERERLHQKNSVLTDLVGELEVLAHENEFEAPRTP